MKIIILLLTAITTTATYAAIPQYEIVDLGTSQSSPGRLLPISINDNGIIVGNDTGTGNCAVMIDSTGDKNHIYFTSDDSVALSINNYNQIAGIALIPAQAVIFDTSLSGGYRNLDTYTIADGSLAMAINDSGIIAASAYVNNRSSVVLFNINYPEQMTIIDNTSLYTSALPWSINSTGHVVGVTDSDYYIDYRWQENADSYESSAFLHNNRGMIQLGTLGGDYSIAYDINNNGQIVGSAEDSQDREYAAIFDTTGNGHNISLGSLYGKESMATAINDSGVVVGTLLEKGGTGSIKSAGYGFYFDGEQMFDIQDLIENHTGWRFDYIYDINNLGQIIGSGTYNGQQHAFLMTPVPEPAALTILAIGTLLIRPRKQSR